MADDLTLYTNPMSRGQITRWMLEEVGQPYAVELLDFGTTMKSDAYRAINPMGKVPAIRHGDRVVTEAAAVCAYLADAFPDAGLAPDRGNRADYYRWMFFAAGPVEHAITNRSLNVEPTGEQSMMVGYGQYDAVVDNLEDWLSRHQWFACDRFTAADVYAGSQVVWGLGFGTLPKRPVFEEYVERVTARDAYLRAKAIDDELIAKMKAEG